jgi:predicted 3-demethylubiquinone-9 3-methyltransferase (glyoxalase superfamily)
MSKIVPCLWFNGNAEEAVNFYVSVIANSRIDHIQRNVTEGPSGKPGSVLLIEFTIGGAPFTALNGGMHFEYTHAVSFYIDCADQAEIDHLWSELGEGGEEVACGWLKDRYGVSWQIVPGEMKKMLADPDTTKAARVMDALMKMVKLDIAELKRAYEGI